MGREVRADLRPGRETDVYLRAVRRRGKDHPQAAPRPWRRELRLRAHDLKLTYLDVAARHKIKAFPRVRRAGTRRTPQTRARGFAARRGSGGWPAWWETNASRRRVTSSSS